MNYFLGDSRAIKSFDIASAPELFAKVISTLNSSKIL
jgi:hypothetical protein